MLVSSAVGVMEGVLEQFRPCFSEPQFRNFSTLNRFLTVSPWSLLLFEVKRLAVVRENLHVPEGSTGFLILDDTINKI